MLPYLINRETACQRCDLQRVCRIDRSLNQYQKLPSLRARKRSPSSATRKAARLKPDFTPDQLRAVRTEHRNLLVSAAAGSGKTEVLAARCAHLVCDASPPCNADELLVVTFTVAAAEEMRSRIGKKLNERAAGSADTRLLRQPMLLAGAQIGTIHSLCNSILRRHFHEAALDPNFRLLDEDEARLLRQDIAEDVVERRLETENPEPIVRLLETYAGGSTRRLIGTLLAMHGRLSSLCDPPQWLAERRLRLEEASRLPLRESELGRKMLGILAERLDSVLNAAERLRANLRNAGASAYAQPANDFLAAAGVWKQALADRSFDQAADIIRSTEFARLPTVKDAAIRERYKPAVDAVKEALQDFKKTSLLLYTEEELQTELGRTLWAVDALAALTDAFADRYAAAKREINSLDFSDLERFTLRLLRDTVTGGPTPIAEDYQRHFKHVLADEYQDVNELQDTLIKLLSREADGNLFCVGDVKQSIYRFRQADPARFIARSERYSAEPPRDGDVINMRMNFRSRGPLLETLNLVFESLMTVATAEVDYDDSQRLVPGATFPESPDGFSGKPIELHVIERKPAAEVSDYDADEREAALVAERILELTGKTGKAPAMVADRNGSQRPADAGDFAVLLRTVRVKTERYASALRRAGIPVLADSTTGFFNSPEIRDVLCALRLIENQRSEYDLAGHLRSPLCQWDAPEDRMAAIRIAYPASVVPWFHRAAARYANEKTDALSDDLRKVFDRLNRWRQAAAERSVADVLWQVLEETQYAVFVAGLPDGEQRMANLNNLHERAKAFDRFRRPTLSRFLHYLSELEEQADLGMPSLASGQQRAVRVMSIHKSKGLEFPIVILPDLGKEFNLREAGDMILFDDTIGIGLRAVDLDREVHYPSLASTVAQHEIRRRSLAEELRVLYVGATRAREKLILIGSADAAKPQAWDDAWQGHRGPIPAGDVLGARSMLDWLGMAAAKAVSIDPAAFDRRVYTSEEIDQLAAGVLTPNSRNDAPSLLADLQPLPTPPKPSAEVRRAIQRLEFTYNDQKFSTQPAVATVTQLTKSGRGTTGSESASTADVVKFSAILRPARCVTPDRQLSPADRGSLTHVVLQRLDFAGDTSPDGIARRCGISSNADSFALTLPSRWMSIRSSGSPKPTSAAAAVPPAIGCDGNSKSSTRNPSTATRRPAADDGPRPN
ncbi:MAG: helicase-exonuclease AddAB subunit AddA [Tepidisphaeraceae bacterium]